MSKQKEGCGVTMMKGGCGLVLLWFFAYGCLVSLSTAPNRPPASRADRFFTEQAMMFHAERRLASLKIRRAVRWVNDLYPTSPAGTTQ